ncbi:MAG: type II toxin-antitoxin system VapC family toxin [Planctomycetota bacterium]
MTPKGLIDTGAILALVDADDAWHERCVAAFSSLRLPLATSAAVLAEVFHLVRAREIAATWRFLRSGAVTLLPLDDEDLRHLDRMMKKYRDRPMDFADASLVRLAERESLSTILTVEHADFEIYRIRGRSRFRVFPQR